MRLALFAPLLAFGLVACADVEPVPSPAAGPPDHVPCKARNVLRNVYFGDLHIHTSLSFDAAAWGTRMRPMDAYRFARGEAVTIPSYRNDGAQDKVAQIDRPLDFAAVTEHSEYLAETALCHDTASPAYSSKTCTDYRNKPVGVNPFTTELASPEPVRLDICDNGTCAPVLGAAWKEVVAAADAAYDKSAACAFTALVAYEWSGSTFGNNLHRNVIFRTDRVPASPISYVDAPTPEQLWERLDAECLSRPDGCDVLAIPHNSNLAAGHMFVPERDSGVRYTKEDALRRSAMEPLVEVFQHKGQSECLSGAADPLASEDEACGFEILTPSVCDENGSPPGCTPLCKGNAAGGLAGACVSPADFVRGALKRGLAEWLRTGADPFHLGFVGATDTHNGLAGGVDEASWRGHVGYGDDTLEGKLTPPGGTPIAVKTDGPGGLTAVWAEENSRASLFDALRRRETYATSGTRPTVRFFGGWQFPEEVCSRADLVEIGYFSGVPMGADMPPPPSTPSSSGPMFVASAARDPDRAPLDRLQIIKGWAVGDQTFEKVIDLTPPEANAGVDPQTCAPLTPGHDTLCATWTDPDHDPTVPAFYYVRVLEVPTCRWSRRFCNDAGVDCAQVEADSPLVACCDGSLPDTLQERAWTSPIWVLPR